MLLKKEDKQELENEGHRISWQEIQWGFMTSISNSIKKANFYRSLQLQVLKTTFFLATLYCLIRQGAKIGEYSFAGSLTLTDGKTLHGISVGKAMQKFSFQTIPQITQESSRITPFNFEK